MKRILIMLAMALAMTAVAGAEETKTTGGRCEYLFFEPGLSATFKQKDTRVIGVDAAVGAWYGPLAVFLQCRGNTALFDGAGTHTYRSMQNLGGGVWMCMWNFKEMKSYLGLRGDITRNLGGKNRWRNTAYRVGLNWRLRSDWKFSPTIGMGYEFIKSRTPGISSFGTAYATVSFWY